VQSLKRALAALLVSGAFVASAAARVEFIAMADGERVPKSEVCFYRTPADFGDLEPLHNFFKNNDVRCVDADKVLDVPVGRFVFYAKNVSQARISRTTFISTRVPSPPESYKAMRIDLLPAAFIDFDDNDREGRFIVAGDSFLPVFERSMLVPAGTRVAILDVKNGVVARVRTLGPLKDREHVHARSDQPPSAALLTTVHVTTLNGSGGSNYELGYYSSTPPEISLESGTKTWQPWIAPYGGETADHALVIFTNVPAGRATVTLAGDFWERNSRTVTLSPATATIDEEGLTTAPAARVDFNFTVDASLWKTCETTAAERVATISISPERKVTVPFASGAATFRGVPAGDYTAELTADGLESVKKKFFATPGKAEHVTFDLFRLTGTVTLAERPIRAKIKFAHGETYSDEDGHYSAVLSRSPAKNVVWVTACGDSKTMFYSPSEEPSENSVLNIALKANAVSVTVRDRATGQAIPKALVQLGVRRTLESDDLYSAALRTDSDGLTVFENLQGDFLTICASADNYKRTCDDQRKLEEKKITVELDQVSTTSGTLITHRTPWVNPTLYFVNRAGNITERLRVKDDLSFIAQMQHTSDEYVVIVSASQPLFVLRPRIGDQIEVAVPDVVPIMNARIVSTSSANTFATLEINGLLVPGLAFAMHQAAHHAPTMIEPAKELPVPEIALTGQVVAVLGPSVDSITELPANGDVFTAPEWRAVLRRRPVDANGVAKF